MIIYFLRNLHFEFTHTKKYFPNNYVTYGNRVEKSNRIQIKFIKTVYYNKQTYLNGVRRVIKFKWSIKRGKYIFQERACFSFLGSKENYLIFTSTWNGFFLSLHTISFSSNISSGTEIYVYLFLSFREK